MLQEHFGYVADRTRLDRFREALARLVAPGDHVADLGCGTGLLGLLCLEAGAGHVYFVDHGAIIDVARQTVQRAGFDERATFITGRSQQVQLPGAVDLVVCDHVGYFGFDYGVVPLLADARRRFLAPGGALFPGRIDLHVAAVESESCRAQADGWSGTAIPQAYHWVRDYAVNTEHAAQLTPDELISAPAPLATLNLHEDQPRFLSWTASLRASRAGVIHGIAGWFECELVEGVSMTNSPLAGNAIDRPQAFLPLGEAVRVDAGDAIDVTVMVRLFDSVTAWTVDIPSTRQRFSQSTLKSLLVTPEDLVAAAPSRVPKLTDEARARMTVLSYCDGQRTALEIEQSVLRHHPALLPSTEETSRFVARVLGLETV